MQFCHGDFWKCGGCGGCENVEVEREADMFGGKR
jgi:hypothetical protein